MTGPERCILSLDAQIRFDGGMYLRPDSGTADSILDSKMQKTQLKVWVHIFYFL